KDLDAIGREDVQKWYETYYAPSNATCVLTGDVDPERAFELAARYLGALPKRPVPAEPSVVEPTSAGEKRLLPEAESEPRVELLFRTPPPDDSSHAALDVIAAILSGEQGRLYKKLAIEQDLTTSIDASDDLRRYAARFRITAKAKPEADLDELE